jgi:hypothetical protein
MSERDKVHPVPGFDPMTQKQVLRTIWKPRMGTFFQNILDTIPRETLNQAKGRQQMQYCLEEIVDVDGQCLHFASKAALMCHFHHHQTIQQAHLTASQLGHPETCVSTMVTLTAGSFCQHSGLQIGSGQGNGNNVSGFRFSP